MLKNARIIKKISLIVLVMTLVAGLIAAIAFHGMHTYHEQTDKIQQASARAVLGERVNGVVLSVVMDSRGLYMSTSSEDIEKYSKPLLKNLDLLKEYLAQWEALLPSEQQEQFKEMEKSAGEFIAKRSELVTISRNQGGPATRAGPQAAFSAITTPTGTTARR